MSLNFRDLGTNKSNWLHDNIILHKSIIVFYHLYCVNSHLCCIQTRGFYLDQLLSYAEYTLKKSHNIRAAVVKIAEFTKFNLSSETP